MSPAPPMQPEVEQQASPEGQQSAFSAQGVGTPRPEMGAIKQVEQISGTIEQGFDSIVSVLRQVHPPLIATLEPAYQAFKMLRKQLQDLAKRSGAAMGSPVMPTPPPPNPAAGPPAPSQVQ